MILLTVALSMLIESLALLKWGGYSIAIPPFTGETSLRLGGVAMPQQTLWVVGVADGGLLALYLLATRPCWASR